MVNRKGCRSINYPRAYLSSDWSRFYALSLVRNLFISATSNEQLSFVSKALNMSKVSKRSNKRSSETMSEEVKDESMSPSTIIFNEEIAPGKLLTYTSWKEHRFVHVHEYEVNGERKYPTKKGACLTPIRLKILMGKFEKIDEQLQQADAKVPCKVQQT